MIHDPDPIAARCVVPGIDCCPAPDHVTIPCPTCDGSPSAVIVGAWSPPDWTYCYTCDDLGTVTGCQACGYVDFVGARCPDECKDWSGEDVAARYANARRG